MNVQHESWPELAATDARDLRTYYLEGSSSWQAALEVLARRSPERLIYAEIEAELGWPARRFGAVFGGWKGSRGESHPRPFHLCRPQESRSGRWEAWMDEVQAAVIREVSGG